MIRNQSTRTCVRLLLPGIALWAVMIFVLHTGRADASAPAPASGQCTTGTSPHGHPLFRCRNKTYHCDAATPDHAQINVVIDSPDDKIDAVHLDAGCSNKSIRLRIETNSGDGVKLHEGAEHLTVWFGKPHARSERVKPHEGAKVGILCTGKHGAVHQDGIQAMGGDHVDFMAPNINCPTGNNGGLFVNGGKGGKGSPSFVRGHGGFWYEGNASVHIGPNSEDSGVEDGVFKTDRSNASPAGCIRVDHEAVRPLNERNECTTPK